MLIRRLAALAVWSATAATVAFWLLLRATNDANALGMLLGFAPRWWAVLPWGVLVPVAFVAGRRTVLGAVIGAAVALVGVAQFELPTTLAAPQGAPQGTPQGTPRGDIRLVTYNTDVSAALASRLRNDTKSWDADVIVLQDCTSTVGDSLRAIFPAAVTLDGFCVASRWPLLDVRPAASLAAPPDARLQQGAFAVRARVQTPYGVLRVFAVHLPSPREALSAARWPKPRVLRPRLQQSLTERGDASAAVSSIVRRSDTRFVVAGDFNLPYGSAILRRDWGHLTNAFARAGVGFGYTMQAGIFPVRIDHVLVPESLEPVGAWVLRGYPSEHQPVVVDLEWRG